MTISGYINVALKVAIIFTKQYTLLFRAHIIVSLQGQ